MPAIQGSHEMTHISIRITELRAGDYALRLTDRDADRRDRGQHWRQRSGISLTA